jgi:putative acetyltransferase
VHIERDDLTRPEVHRLLADHLADMHATSPAESVHALDLTGLRRPDVTMWTLWDDGALLGCAALRELSPDAGEIKSMRTVAEARGRGLGRLLLEHVIAEAQGRGYRRLSLETGAEDFFAPARRLYARHRFTECPPFGDYTLDPHSVYMTREV